MSTRKYTVGISVVTYDENGQILGSDVLAELYSAPGWEVISALKSLISKIHESPPPVVLEGQEPML